VGEDVLQNLRDGAGAWRTQLAQGAAFAAKARQRAGNLAEHTRVAARILCGMTADEAAQVTDAALENLPARAAIRSEDAGATPAYEIWRQRIQERFQNQFGVKPQLQEVR
jgi:hypothetical protein